MGDETDPQLSLETLRKRLNDYYQACDSDGDNWYRCHRTTGDGSRCNTKVYFSARNPTDLRRHERRHSSPDRQGSSADERPDESASRGDDTGTVARSGTGGADDAGHPTADPTEAADTGDVEADGILESIRSEFETR